VLLTGLGIEARTTRYELDGRSTERPLAPLALVDLLPDPFDEVVAVYTKTAAEKTLAPLKEGLGGRVPLRDIQVREAFATGDIVEFVEKVARSVLPDDPEGVESRLVVDLTHGFRHQAVLIYVITLYLASLERVRLERVFYGAFDPGTFVDLTPLVVMPQLVHAVRVTRETGSTRALARVIAAYADGRNVVRDVARMLEDVSRHLLAGLPIETGSDWENFTRTSSKQLRGILGKDLGVPLVKDLLNDLGQVLDPLAVAESRKSEIRLDEAELRRQAYMIDRLFEWEMDWTALGLSREWMVSWALWCGEGSAGSIDGWLERERRTSAERRLHVLQMLSDDGDLRHLLSDDQVRVGKFWSALCELRNAFMHFGMRKDRVDPRKPHDGSSLHKHWETIAKEWGTFLGCSGGQPLRKIALDPPEQSGRVLVSALGMAAGVLTNAIRHARATSDLDHVLVICSPESAVMVGEAVERSGWSGRVTSLVVADPMDPEGVLGLVGQRSSGRIKLFPGEAKARRLIACADEVVVNLTGGTTAMMLGTQLIVEGARQYQRPVKCFVLADRRPSEEQRRDPWAPCDVGWLDST